MSTSPAAPDWLVRCSEYGTQRRARACLSLCRFICLCLAISLPDWQLATSFPLIARAAAAERGKSPPASTAGQSSTNSLVVKNASGAVQRNYPLQFGRPFLPGEIQDFPVLRINGARIPTQADVKNRYADGSVKYAIISAIISELPATGSLSLSFENQHSGNNDPLSTSQMLAPEYNFMAQIILTDPNGQKKSVDAKSMLENGDYKIWTSGPIAQTIILGDDGPERKYDIGFDGHRPFRPRFIATLWPTNKQIFLRFIGENANSQELGDLDYIVDLTTGNQRQHVYNKKLMHYAMSTWTKTFWIGITPTMQVSIDYNLAYLTQIKFFPNFDIGIKIPERETAAQYAAWSKAPHDLFDGGFWEKYMPTTGQRVEIGPYPQWSVVWLYSGDWRLRQIALNMADLAAAWPAHLRETVASKNLLRSDKPGAGSGLDHTISISTRPTFMSSDLRYDYTKTEDKIKIVGNISSNPWVFDGAHQPAAFYPQYILTGDPFYLSEMYFWAGFSAARYNGAATDYPYGRGPTGAEGAIADQIRGAGWVLRNRAEAAFAAPDADREKKYFTRLVGDAIARWEGGFEITGTAFEGTPEWKWGRRMGNVYSCNSGPVSCRPPTLHNWEANCNPRSEQTCGDLLGDERDGVVPPNTIGSYTAPWMQFYLLYGLGRAAELGFPTEALLSWSAQWLAGMINDSGHPMLIATYHLPVEPRGGGFFPTWRDVIATYTERYLKERLQAYFAGTRNDSRAVWAGPALAYIHDHPGGAQAWGWFYQNVYKLVPDFNADPKWAIVPRVTRR